MYKRILVPVENSSYDDAIVQHVRGLAKLCNAAVVLIHVADGFAARNAKQLDLRESEEMRLDLGYLEKLAAALEADGIDADSVLAGGDPAKEIAGAAEREQFFNTVLKRGATEYRSAWAAQQFGGRRRPPLQLTGTEAVKAHLQRHADAIGYLPLALVDASLRIVYLP